MLRPPDSWVRGVPVERLVGARQLASGDPPKQRDRTAAAQPLEPVLRGASRGKFVEQAVDADPDALRPVPEQLSETVVKDAACAQAACVGRVLGTAPAAEVVSGCASAPAADRLLIAAITHQPMGLPAVRAGVLGRERALVAAAADRALSPVGRWT
jgi:hypothetical protein